MVDEGAADEWACYAGYAEDGAEEPEELGSLAEGDDLGDHGLWWDAELGFGHGG